MSLIKNTTTSNVPPIDLETIHQTLSYILDDIADQQDLTHVAKAVAEAISQIEIAQVRQKIPDLQILRHARYTGRYY